MPTTIPLDQILHDLRSKQPLTQCITNFVAMNICANVLLAAGASPAMVHSKVEVGEFAALANALTINIGTLSPDWVDGMIAAISAANAAGNPWILDPVAHFATSFRRDVTQRLINLQPKVIRGNASEIIALSGIQSNGSGADSRDRVDHAVDSAISIAKKQSCVVAVTGERDFVTDGNRSAFIYGGSAIMPKITALGCSLTGLVGAFSAVHQDTFEATVAALAFFAVCGEKAGTLSNGPGSFEPIFLDQLALMTPDKFLQATRITFL